MRYEEEDYAAFEADLLGAFGGDLRKDPDGFGPQVWSALANIIWLRAGDPDREVAYSFRAAGRLIAEIVGDTSDFNYMRWYCSGPYETVSPEIEAAMAARGWTWAYYPRDQADLG